MRTIVIETKHQENYALSERDKPIWRYPETIKFKIHFENKFDVDLNPSELESISKEIVEQYNDIYNKFDYIKYTIEDDNNIVIRPEKLLQFLKLIK